MVQKLDLFTCQQASGCKRLTIFRMVTGMETLQPCLEGTAVKEMEAGALTYLIRAQFHLGCGVSMSDN